jgi:hypothetical protein
MGARIAAGEARLNALPGVRRSCLCPYQKAGGVGLYAFIESDLAPSESRAEADHIQPVPALPRGPEGRLRRDLLSLVAENRVAEVDPLLAEDPATARIMAPIIAGRLNLTDRYIR